MGRIVVGVDGSETSRQALMWAAEEAVLRDAALEVIYVFEHTPAWLSYADGGGMMSAAHVEAVRQDLEEAAREAASYAESLVAAMVEDLQGVEAKAVALEGHRPAQTLVERSTDADLLVVGSRGRGGFTGLLLGSVSQQCATHASCPVVVIRAQAESAGPARAETAT